MLTSTTKVLEEATTQPTVRNSPSEDAISRTGSFLPPEDPPDNEAFHDAAAPGPESSRTDRRCCCCAFCRKVGLSRTQILYISVVAFVVLMLNADQNLLAPSLSVVADEFNMTDSERDLYLGGYLSIAFFVSGGVSAIAAGLLADTSNRKMIFASIVIVGEISCFCTIFVTSFWGLFATRFVTGFAMGGAMPVLYSLIGDSFVDEWRGRATSLMVLLGGAGVLVGQTLAALIAPVFGWRVPFAVVSLPALICIAIFIIFVEEPPRGNAERAIKNAVSGREDSPVVTYSETMSAAKLYALLKTPTVALLLLMGLPGSLPWGFLLVYAQDFLINDVGPTIPGGISSSQSLLVVLVFAISSGVGNLLGGWVTDVLWKRNMILVCVYAGCVTLLSAIPMYILANVKLPYIGYCFLVIPGGFLNALGAIAKGALLLNCTLPETRGTAFAINALVDDLGRGLGSFIIALMIVGLGGRVPAFNVAFGGWIVSGICFLLATGTLRKDVDEKNRRLVASLALDKPPRTADSSFEDTEIQSATAQVAMV